MYKSYVNTLDHGWSSARNCQQSKPYIQTMLNHITVVGIMTEGFGQKSYTNNGKSYNCRRDSIMNLGKTHLQTMVNHITVVEICMISLGKTS